MSTPHNKVGSRERNDFASGTASDMTDPLSNMADWLESDQASEELSFPRVVGKLPDLGGQKKTPQSKRLRIGKLLGSTTLLAVAFGLGVASGSFHYGTADSEKLAEDDASPAPSIIPDSAISEQSDWSNFPEISSSSYSTFGDLGHDVDLEGSSLKQNDELLYTNLDEIAFTSGGDRDQKTGLYAERNAADSWSAPSSAEQSPEPNQAEYASVAPATQSDDYATSDANASFTEESAGGFSGFQGYAFSEDVPSGAHDQKEETLPTQTAENDRSSFLSSSERSFDGFNDNSDFSDFKREASQEFLKDDANYAASSFENSYNDQTDSNGSSTIQPAGQNTLARSAYPTESNQVDSRFRGFGSSWNAPDSEVGGISSDSPFPEDALEGEYVARDFDNRAVEAPTQNQKPVRALRW